MKLGDYLAETGQTDADFAKAVGVHKSTVGRWVAGTVKPEWALIAKITEVTGSKVTANDFVEGDMPSPSGSVAA